MRKILILFVLLFLCACQQTQTMKYVAVLENNQNDRAAILFMDENYGQIKSIDIDFPNDVLFTDRAVYYSTDATTYQGYLYSNFEKSDSFKVSGYLMHHDPNTCTIVFEQNKLVFLKDNVVLAEYPWQEISMFRIFGDKLYTISLNRLIIFDLATTKIINEATVTDSSFYSMTEIDGNLYLTDDFGYAQIKDNEIVNTFLYPKTFDAIQATVDDRLTVVEDGEIAVYNVTFDKYQMILTANYDEEYLNPIDFEKLLSDWYQKGYEVAYFKSY